MANSSRLFTIDNLTVKSYDAANSSFDITEHVDPFTVDGSGYANETPVYDLTGNLTFDGVYQYSYDAWNRLITTTKTYRDGNGDLQSGQTFDIMSYDGRGRSQYGGWTVSWRVLSFPLSVTTTP
ncbi:MAG TPA: hypothetical protein VIL86_06010 [Tepidisphaeraceae bacterium]|jgi:YD repeat-containing protein